MKMTLKFPLLIGVLCGTIYSSQAQLPKLEPTLDLVAKDGDIRQLNSPQREVIVSDISNGSDSKLVALQSPDAITIPYQSNDPLFEPGPFTWLLKGTLANTSELGGNYILMGRWQAGPNRRVAGILIHQPTGGLQFLVSPMGGVEGISNTIIKSTLPEKTLLTMVARYLPGKKLVLEVYDAEGNLLDADFRDSEVVEKAFETEIPLLIGSDPSVGFELQRATVWPRFLSDAEVGRLVNH